MYPDLSGQHVFISGAGRGLGRSVALHLAKCGAVVGVGDIDAATCDETAQLAKGHSYPGDYGRRETFLDAAAEFAKVGGRIDAVVNNAAFLRYEAVESVTQETFEKMVGIGLGGVVWGTQALLAHYDPKRGGNVINMASPVAYKGYPNTSVYSSIKAAIVGITHTLAAELGPRNVRVNAVAPASVPTPGAVGLNSREEYERRSRTIPLRRLGAEEDNDNAIAFLLSAQASFVTGTVLHVDGGVVASM